MSRIGKAPIQIPEKLTVNIEGGHVEVKGPKGSMKLEIPDMLQVNVADGQIQVNRQLDSKEARARHGLVRKLIYNMVHGVSEGFSKTLEISGVGYRAEVKGKEMVLSLGYSHPVVFQIPDGINVKVNKQTEIIIEGFDRQVVGETAARIRSLRAPEPYKGKGIKYSTEVIVRKAGKAAV